VYLPYAYNGKALNVGTINKATGQITTNPNWTATALKSAVMATGQLQLWQNQKAFLVAFETIGSTFRDFEIPLSTLLVSKSQAVNGQTNPFQSYLYQRLIDWAGGSASLGFNSSSFLFDKGSWALGMTSTESTPQELNEGDGPIHSELVASNRDLV
jgi:hypothetical protein